MVEGLGVKLGFFGATDDACNMLRMERDENITPCCAACHGDKRVKGPESLWSRSVWTEKPRERDAKTRS